MITRESTNVTVSKRQLTDGLYDHSVHFVWTELQFIARETEEERQTGRLEGEDMIQETISHL